MTASPVNRLVNDVEELLAELSDGHGAEVDALRKRIAAGLQAAKRPVPADGEATAILGRAITSLDAYIMHYPRVAFASALLVAGAVGYLAGATGRSRRR